LRYGPPGKFSFQGDKVVEAYNFICNQSKDQVNDVRHEVNLVSYKGGSARDTGYLYIYKSRYMKPPLTLYTPSNHINYILTTPSNHINSMLTIIIITIITITIIILTIYISLFLNN